LRDPLGRPAGLPDWPGLNNQGFPPLVAKRDTAVESAVIKDQVESWNIIDFATDGLS